MTERKRKTRGWVLAQNGATQQFGSWAKLLAYCQETKATGKIYARDGDLYCYVRNGEMA